MVLRRRRDEQRRAQVRQQISIPKLFWRIHLWVLANHLWLWDDTGMSSSAHSSVSVECVYARSSGSAAAPAERAPSAAVRASARTTYM